MLTTARSLLTGCLILVLCVGCGGGGGSSSTTPSTTSSAVPRLLSLDTAGVSTIINQFGTYGAQLLTYGGTPVCGVDFYHFEYNTVDAAGAPTTASGGLLVPTGSTSNCSGSRPIVMYGHGDSLYRYVNMADISAANAYNSTTALAAVLFAAQGYIVVASNYAGYDTSNLSYHPEHIAAQNGQEMIDAVTAARRALPQLLTPIADNGQLFLTGYSDGGYVAMAAHRAMQAANIAVTASAPESGAYAESVHYESLAAPGALDNLSRFSLSDQMQIAEQITAWQKAYGNLYTTPSQVYPAAYSSSMETLLPTNASDINSLVPSQFPAYLLGNDMPNYPSLTPPEQAYYGPPAQSLLLTSFVTALLADITANPCPVTTTNPLNCTPQNNTHAAWLKNDLRTWTPTAPMLMCGGHADPEVGFDNAELAQAYFGAHGVTVPVLDVDSAITTNDPYATAKTAFTAIEQSIVAAGGDPTTEDNYHGYMVFVACGVAARDYFNTFVAQ